MPGEGSWFKAETFPDNSGSRVDMLAADKCWYTEADWDWVVIEIGFDRKWSNLCEVVVEMEFLQRNQKRVKCGQFFLSVDLQVAKLGQTVSEKLGSEP